MPILSFSSRSRTVSNVLWSRENFPRIVEELPRRLPRPDYPSILQGFEGELRSLFLPDLAQVSKYTV